MRREETLERCRGWIGAQGWGGARDGPYSLKYQLGGCSLSHEGTSLRTTPSFPTSLPLILGPKTAEMNRDEQAPRADPHALDTAFISSKKSTLDVHGCRCRLCVLPCRQLQQSLISSYDTGILKSSLFIKEALAILPCGHSLTMKKIRKSKKVNGIKNQNEACIKNGGAENSSAGC